MSFEHPLSPRIQAYLDACGPVERERLMTTDLVRGTMVTESFRGNQIVAVGCLIGVARGAVEAHRNHTVIRDVDNLEADRQSGIHHHFDSEWMEYFNPLDLQQQIRDYIVQLRLQRGGTIEEPSYVGELSDATA